MKKGYSKKALVVKAAIIIASVISLPEQIINITCGNQGNKSNNLFAQVGNTWTQDADMPIQTIAGRYLAVGFAIGTKGYICTGNESGTYKKDLWEYNPSSNTWTQKADFGGTARYGAVGFVIGTKAYVGTGNDGAYRNDFWSYDQTTNSWTAIANFTGTARYAAAGFAIASLTKGYVGTGYDGAYKNDFFEYNPSTNVWTQKANISGTARYGAVGFSLSNSWGTYGCIALGGTGLSTYASDLLEYTPGTNTWSTNVISLYASATTFTGRRFASCFTDGNSVWIGLGIRGNVISPISLNDWNVIYQQGIIGDQRTGQYYYEYMTQTNYTGAARYAASAFYLSSYGGYVGTGYSGIYNNDFYLFNTTANTWTAKANLGVPYAGTRYGAVGFSIGTKGYIGTGYNGVYRNDFWEYDPSTNVWAQKADFGGTARYLATGFSVGSKGYIGTGYNAGAYYNDFWEYDANTNVWTQKASFAGTARYGATGFGIGAKGYIGTGYSGAYRNDFWEYDQATNIWTQKANAGTTLRYGGVGFSIGTKGYIGTGSNGVYLNDFWEYDQSTNVWTQRANFGGTGRDLAIGMSIGNKGYIGTGSNPAVNNDFYEYNPSTNTWTARANYSGGARYVSSCFSIGDKGYLGTGYNAGTYYNDLWEYASLLTSITTNSISPTTYCAGATINVDYTTTGYATYIASTTLIPNVFTAQLSNASGSFASPVNIGTLTSYTSGTITATIPYGTAAGSGYRIRIISSIPAIIGTDNGTNITILASPVATVTPSSSTLCSGQSTNITLSSNMANSTYGWTVTQSGTSGGSGGSGSSINQALTFTSITGGLGSAVYSVTPTGSNGCAGATIAANVNVYDIPVMTNYNYDDICNGGVSYVYLTSNTPSTYSWIASNNPNTIGESLTVQTSTVIANTITNSSNVTQTVTYTVTPTAIATGCIGVPQIVTVDVNPSLIMTSVSSATICNGNSVSISLTSNVSASYYWVAADNANTTGESTTYQYTNILSNTIINNTSTAQIITYSVTPYYYFGGPNELTCYGNPQIVNITVNPSPTMTSSSSSTLCSGASFTMPLTSNISSNYSWIAADNANTSGESLTTQNTGTISNVVVNNTLNLQSVLYSVTPTAIATGCAGTQQTVLLNSYPSPLITNISTTSPTLCSGSSTSISVAATAPYPSGYCIPVTSCASNDYIAHVTFGGINRISTCDAPSGGYSLFTSPNPNYNISTSYALSIVTTSSFAQGVAVWIDYNQNGIFDATELVLNGYTGIAGAVYSGNVTIPASAYRGTTRMRVRCVYLQNPSLTTGACGNTSYGETEDYYISIVNGLNNLTYNWSPATFLSATNQATVFANTVTSSTTYSSTVTSVQGCSSNASTSISVNPNPAMTSASLATICSGGTVNIPLTSTVPSTFTWYAQDNTNTTGENTTAQTTATVNNTITNNTSSAQVVTYFVTPVSTLGCSNSNTQTISVTVNPKPAMTSPTVATICSGGSVSIAFAANTASTFTWLASDNANTTGESTTTQSASTLSNTIINNSTTPQLITYTVTPTSTTGGCVGTSQIVTVTVNPKPNMTSTSSVAVCSGSTVSILLTSDITSTFSWLTIDNTNTTGESTTAQSTSTLSNTIVNTSAVTQSLTYTVTPTSTVYGCIGNAQNVTVTVYPKPTMTSASTATICSGGTVSIALTSSTASSYTWLAGDNVNTTGESTTIQNTSSLSNTIINNTNTVQTITYTVTPTSTSGSCVGIAQVVTVTVNPKPTMTSANAATICSGLTITIPLTSDIPSTYVWSATDNTNTTGESTTLQTTSTLNNTITNSSLVSQTVIYSVIPTSSAGLCVGNGQTVSILVNPTPVITNISSATICSGGIVNIPLTSSVASSFTWLAANSPNVTGESTTSQNSSTLNNTLINSTGSVQTVSYTVTAVSSGGGCFGSNQIITVTVNPLPAMTSPTVATICSGGSVSIAFAANTASTFTWLASDNANTTGESTTTQSASTLSNTIINNSTTPQLITYTVTPTSTTGGCVGTSQIVTVTVNPKPNMTSTSSVAVCSGSTVSILLTSDITSTFSWLTIDNTNTTGESTTAQSTSTLSNTIVNTSAVTQSLTYTVTPTSTVYGCIGNAQNVTVTVYPKPTMTSASTATICSGGTVSIALTSSTASSYTWLAGDNVNTTGESTTIQNTSSLSNTIINNTNTVQTITYTVTPTSTSGSCVGIAQVVTVTVNPKPTMTSANAATICSGLTITIPLTSDIPSTYVWSATDNTNTTGESTTLQTTSTLNNTITNSSLVSQTVIYSVIPTSSAGLCVGNGQTVSILVNPTPVITNISSATICSGGIVNIPLTSSVASSFTWLAANSPNVTGESTTSQNSSTLNNTLINSTGSVQTVSYTVTAVSSGGGCFGSNQIITVTVNPLPTVTVNSATICSGASAALVASGASTYVWNTGATTNSINVSPVITTTYSATGTSIAGCINSGSGVVTVNPLDNASFSYSSSTFCQTGTNPTPTVIGLSGGTFSSTTGLVFVSTSTGQINLTASTLNSYGITYTTNGVCQNTSTYFITITTAPTATFSYVGSPFCNNASNPSPTFASGSSAGLFSAIPAGLLFVSTSTGVINLLASTPGTYTVTNFIAAASGCSAAIATSVVTVNPLPIATISYSTPPYCATTGTAAVTRTGQAGGTYSSSGGLSINSATGAVNLATSVVGSYIVTYTFTNGTCSNTTAATITINALPTASINYSGTPYCASGSATVTQTGQAGGTYSSTVGLSINSSTGTVNLNTSTAGSYTVTYSFTNGTCSNSTTGTITINALPTASISYTGSPYCALGTATVTQSGQTGGNYSSGAGLTINSSTGAIDLVASTPGAYTVTYSFNNGICNNTTSATITINSLPTASISYIGSPYCATGAASVTRTGQAGGTYSSTAGLSINSATGALNLASSTAGTYTVIYTFSSGSCSNTTSTSISINALPPATISYTGSPYCASGTATVTQSGQTGGAYSSGAGLSINSSTGNIDLSASTAGTYTVTYSFTDGTCSNTATSTLTVNALPIASISYSASPYCASGIAAVTRTGQAGGTYSSSGGLSINSATGAVNLATSVVGSYIVTYTFTNGTCSNTTAATITINALPTASINYSGTPYCASGSATVTQTGQAGGTYSSTVGLSINSSTGTVNLNTSTAGSYTVTYSFTNGTCSNSTTGTITINALPTASISYTGSPYCALGTATVTQSGQTGGNYSSGAGLTINSSTGAIDLVASTPGAYTVTYSFNNGICNNTTSATITINSLPTASISYIGSPYCATGAASVTRTGQAGGTYSSTAGLSINSATGALNLASSTAGTYTVIYTFSSGSCSNTTSTSISINALPPATISYTGSPYCASGTATVTQSGQTGGAYSSGAGLSINSSTGNIDLSASTAGTYTVTYSFTDGTCSNTATSTLTVNALPIASISYSASPYCASGIAAVTRTGQAGGTYSGGVGLVINTSTGAISLGSSNSGTYLITYTFTNGICSTTATAFITINPLPIATVSYSGSPYCATGTASATQIGQGGGSYSATGGLSINSSNGDINLSGASGAYVVTYSYSDGNCANNSTANVTINPLPTATIFYTGSPYCASGTAPVTRTGLAGGTYSSSAGLVINSLTGDINLAASTAGTYTVTYAFDNGTCNNTTTAAITINALPTATIIYSGSPYCATGNVLVTRTGQAGGTYSSTTGLSINSSTGAINLNTSNAGAYTIVYTFTNGTCSNTANTSMSINPLPNIVSSNNATICSGGNANILLTSDISSSFTWMANDNSNTVGESTTVQTTSNLSNSIINNTNTVQTVTYTVTPTASSSGCVGNSQLVSITINPKPNLTNASSATICNGSTVNIGLTADVPTSFSWVALDNANTSGESVTPQISSILNNTISNPTSGTQTVSYNVIATSVVGNCASTTQVINVLINPTDDASFSYTSPAYCQSGVNPIATITGLTGGTFSAAAGLVFIDANTGLIDLVSSAAGAYSISYVTNGACINSSVNAIDITSAPFANFSYSGTPYCQGATNSFPTLISGASAGVFSCDSVGLVFVDTTTGELNLIASTPGTYSVTNTIAAANGCAATSSSSVVTVSLLPVATFAYTASPYCSSGSNAIPVYTGGGQAGIFGSDIGLTIDASTGEIDVTSSITGTYTVTNTIAANAGCPVVSADAVLTVTQLASALFSYSGTPFCVSTVNPLPVLASGAVAGIYSSASGISLDTLSGAIDLIASNAGTYVITNSIAASGGCPNVSHSDTITVHPAIAVNAGNDQSVCDSTTTLVAGVANGGVGSLTYTWDNGSSNYAAASFNVMPLANSTYTLTVTDSAGCAAKDDVNINVATRTDLYGHVGYSGGPVTNGSVVLYHWIPPYILYNRERTTLLDASGNYHFANVANKDYIVKVFPNQTTYPTLVNTYFTSTFVWDTAAVTNHDCAGNDTLGDIAITEMTGPFGGPGSLSGYIWEGPGFRAEGDPVPGVDVKVGRDPNGGIAANVQTDAAGYYYVNNLPLGNYKLYVDIPGLLRDSTYHVSITSTNLNIPNLNYKVDSVRVYPLFDATGADNEHLAASLIIYPNPNTGKFTVSCGDRKIQNICVYDMIGKCVMRQQPITNNPQLTVDMSGFAKGVYFIQVTDENKNSVNRKIVLQ